MDPHSNYQYDYSNLEVAQQHDQQHAQANGGFDKYVATSPNPQEWTHGSRTPQLAYDGKSLPEPVQYGPNQGRLADRRILGLKRKTFFIVLALVLFVVIAAVVGGAVGGILSRKSGSSPPSPTSTPSSSPSSSQRPNAPVLSNSSITAINYTVTDGGATYRMVFWQHNSSDLMLSVWDSTNGTWEVTNIAQNTADTSISTAALPGTPLAAAVRGYPWTEDQYFNSPFGIALFYLTPSNVIRELYSTDPRGGAWQLGDLTTSNSNWEAGSGSKMGVWWALCASTLCSGDIALFYESTAQALMVGNSSNWSNGAQEIVANIEAGTGIGVTAVAPVFGSQGPAADSPRVYYDSSGVLQEIEWEQDDQPWAYASTIGHTLPSNPPAISAMAFANATNITAGPLDLMVVPCFDNGSVIVNWWDNTVWSFGNEPILQGKVYTNFTAATLLPAEDLKFFGVTDEGAIQAYTIDRAAPVSWTYDSEVDTS